MVEKLDKEAIRDILASRFKTDKCTKLSLIPQPCCFKDIDKATKRIVEAIKLQTPIGIVGDYDVDGVISSVILTDFFDALNAAYVLKIPNRFNDGYGLNPNIVKEIGTSLIITVDNGINAHEAADFCKANSIDLIITDHHTPAPTLPNAYAIINPKQESCDFPHSEICGAQVAWYLVASLKKEMNVDYDLAKSLDLLAVAIVADMMELLDINRTMVIGGISSLNSSMRPAFESIKLYFKKDQFESDDISFLIAPLINSSGRMDDAHLSYDFLKSQSLDEAMCLLEPIVSLNNQRKEEEQRLFDASLEKVEPEDNIVVVWGKSWHEGVIGIVASRLARRFNKPSIVFSIENGYAKGSARGVGEIDMLSLLVKNKKFLLGFGGHKGAAGMQIESRKLTAFKSALNIACKDIPSELTMDNEVLGEVDPEIIDFELLKILECFEPYGQKNPRPAFLIKSAEVKIAKLIGREKTHLKLILQTKTKTLESLFFNFDTKVKKGDIIDIIFTVQKNAYRGLVTPQLLIKQVLSYK